jgi:hypothetical protein
MKKLLFIFLFSISFVTYAQWIFILDANETEIYVDSKTISQVNQYRRAWFKLEYSLNSEMTKVNVRSSRVYREFDCREKRVRNLSLTTFTQSNLSGVSKASDKVGEWSFIAPNTNAELLLEVVCNKK